MTTVVTQTEWPYVGDDSTVDWPFTFSVTTTDDVAVYLALDGALVSTKLNPSTYTVTYDAETEGGSVEYPLTGSPLTTADNIAVSRETVAKQGANLTDQTVLKGSQIEAMGDNNNRQVQDNTNALKRAVKVDVTSQDDADDLLQAISDAEASCTADAVLTAADVVSTNADVVSTNADVVLTNADVVTCTALVESVDLPTIAADSYLRSNAAGDEYETKTVTEVKADLGVDTNTTNIGTNTSNIGTNTSAIALNTAKGTRDVLFTGSAGISTINLSQDMDDYTFLEITATDTSSDKYNSRLLTVGTFKETTASIKEHISFTTASTDIDIRFHYATDTSITISNATSSTLTKVVGIK